MVSICSVLRRRQSQLSGAKKLSCIHTVCDCNRSLPLLDEVVRWVFCPLLLFDGGSCRGNVDRGSGGSSHRGWWTSCDSCASTWLRLHCGRKQVLEKAALLLCILYILNWEIKENDEMRLQGCNMTWDGIWVYQLQPNVLLSKINNFIRKERGEKKRRAGAVRMDPSHLVPEAGQGRGRPGWQDLGRLQLQVLQGWWKRRRRKEYWRLGPLTRLQTE